MTRRKPFKKADRYVWQWHYSCFICGKNTADALHHIISASDQIYEPGDHNASIYNSSPLCNHTCHIGREAELTDKIPDFLNRTKNYIDNTDYERKERDEKFLQVYSQHYLDNQP